MKKFTLMLALLAAPSLVLASCGDDPAVVDEKINSVSVSLKKSEITVGSTTTATANVSAEGGAKTTVTWKSDNEAVATVDSSGKVTAKGVGEANITATSTVDTSKSGSAKIKVVAADWSAADKEFMETYFGEVFPYVDGGFEWTDGYYDDYGCMSAEASGDHAKAAYTTLKAAPGFVDEGSETSEGVTFYMLTKDFALSDDYYLYFEIYSYQGTTSIDVYFEMVEYDEWPTDVIAAAMTECGFEGTVPSFDAGDEAGYTASVQELEDGSPCVYITVTDYDEESYLGASDYVDSLNPANYIIIEESYDYIVSPLDKSFSMIVYDLDSYYYYGFEIIVTDYIADDSIVINEGFDMIAVGGNLQLTLTKGIDVADSTVVTFTSSNEAVATVSADGLITGIAKGEVTISAKVGDEVVSEALFYIVDSIRTEWSTEEKAEFDKIHAGLGDKIPFNKFFDSVEFNDEDGAVYVDSSMYSTELTAFREALVADGWTDILVEEFGDMADFAYYFGYPYMFEKDIEIDGAHYFVGIDLYAGYVDEEYEEFVQDVEGYMSAVVYDNYVYSYADAISEVKSLLNDFEIETTADFPDALPGSHFYVGYDSEYNDIDLYAYDATGVTLQNVIDALKAKGWDVEKCHEDEYVDEETGETVPACDYLYGYSNDEVLEIEGYVEDGMVILYVYLPSTSGQLMDINDLHDGDSIYVVSLDAGLGLGAYNGKKNFASVSLYDETLGDYSFDDCTCFIVSDNGDGTWGLEDEDGNAYGADGSKNIKIDGASSYDWTISIDDEGNAIMECAGWVLMLNETTSPAVYKTYASSFEGTAVQIFVA